MRLVPRFLRQQGGAEAAEFALVLPLLAGLTIGVMEMLLVLFANTALHFAVDDAARCMSVNTLICTDAASTQVYAASHYTGPPISPVFTAAAARCGDPTTGPTGSLVSATGQWRINAIVFRMTVPLSARACFPT